MVQNNFQSMCVRDVNYKGYLVVEKVVLDGVIIVFWVNKVHTLVSRIDKTAYL